MTFIFRFLALPSLLHAPCDYARLCNGLPPRPIYAVEPEVLGSKDIVRKPISIVLDFSEQYRMELARAFAEVHLLTDEAAVNSVLERRPLREFRDHGRLHRARMSCNGEDPVAQHLHPLLVQLGHQPT